MEGAEDYIWQRNCHNKATYCGNFTASKWIWNGWRRLIGVN